MIEYILTILSSIFTVLLYNYFYLYLIGYILKIKKI